MKRAIFCLVVTVLSMRLTYAGDLASKQSSNQPSVEFFKEEITLSVSDSQATINGTYYFRNNTDEDWEFPVLFPFYMDSLSLFPFLIRPYFIDSSKVVDLNYRIIENTNSISLAIPLKPHSTTIWHLDYAQKIKAQKARYIITSTNIWGKPLEEATCKFIVPSKFNNVVTWPAADTSYTDGTNTVFLSHQKEFLPQRDMEVSWRKK